MRIGLALGGGAARGLAHLGVLTVLEQAQVPITCVAGTSVGSVVGAAYCTGMPLEQLQELAARIGWRQVASLTWSVQGFVSFEKLERWMVALLGDLDFSALPIPFAAVATDLESGEPLVLRTGRLAPAVRASCTVPGIVAPLRRDGRLLVDGFAADNLPVAAARALGADYVIGVDICQPKVRRRWGPLGVGIAALENMARRVGNGLASADCVISPAVAGFSYVRFSRREELIALGMAAAEEKLPQIQAALARDPDPDR